jgi:trigger factor
MPSLDDEFAKDLGIETLEVLKTRVKENLERERQNSVKSEIEKQIIDKLLEENNFAVPPSLVKQQAERLMERQKERLGEQGYGKDDADKVLDRIKADIQKEAERQIRLAYILDAIADLEEVKVSDEEVAARIDLMISQSQPKERPSVEKILKGPYRDRIRSEMREEKLFTWLTEQAKIKEV